MSLCVSCQKVDNAVPDKKQESWECLVQKASKKKRGGWLAASNEVILTQENTSGECRVFCVWFSTRKIDA